VTNVEPTTSNREVRRPAADFEPTLSSRFVVYIRDYLLDRGVDADPVFLACSIPTDSEEEYVYPIPVPRVAALFEAAVEKTGDTCVGLHMAQNYHYESSSLIILAMLASPSVEEGIRCLCRYDQYIDTGIETEFNYDRNLASFSARIINPTNCRVDQLNEYLLSFIVKILTTATRQQVPVVEVWFRHDSDRNRQALESFFNAPVKFSQSDNRLLFSREFLKERFFTTNNLLYEILTDALKTYFSSTAERYGFIDAVSREIIRLSTDEAPSMEAVAASLAISPRTLRRRLTEEGYSFQEVKSFAREKRARYYLSHTSLSLSEIAFELGYSELSAFSRAFRTWTGETPQVYREKVQQLIRG
jgi:AraC-like DNA-binding protein